MKKTNTTETESNETTAHEGSLRTSFTMKVTKRTITWMIVVLVILAVLASIARFFHVKGWGLSQQERDQRAVATLVKKINVFMLLPNEMPVVATVTDAESLKTSQPFYKDAVNGDVLLLYSVAQRAILYRPSDNRIINVGPVYLNQSAPAPQTASSTSTNSKSAKNQ